MEERRKVTRVRNGIEGDKKLQDDESLVYDKATGSYYAVRKKKNEDAAAGKTRLTTQDKKY